MPGTPVATQWTKRGLTGGLAARPMTAWTPSGKTFHTAPRLPATVAGAPWYAPLHALQVIPVRKM